MAKTKAVSKRKKPTRASGIRRTKKAEKAATPRRSPLAADPDQASTVRRAPAQPRPQAVPEPAVKGQPKPYSALMEAVYRKIYGLGMTVKDYCRQSPSNMHESYVFSLRNGPRDPAKMGRVYMEEFAEFIGVSTATAMVMAGALQPKDFLYPKEDLHTELQRHIRYIRDDPAWASFIPNEDLSESVAIALIRAYEIATGRVLLTRDPSPPFYWEQPAAGQK